MSYLSLCLQKDYHKWTRQLPVPKDPPYYFMSQACCTLSTYFQGTMWFVNFSILYRESDQLCLSARKSMRGSVHVLSVGASLLDRKTVHSLFVGCLLAILANLKHSNIPICGSLLSVRPSNAITKPLTSLATSTSEALLLGATLACVLYHNI